MSPFMHMGIAHFFRRFYGSPIRIYSNIEVAMSAGLKASEAIPSRQDGAIEKDDLVWQIIKAIRNTRSGQVEITVQNSSVVEVHRAETGLGECAS